VRSPLPIKSLLGVLLLIVLIYYSLGITHFSHAIFL